VNGIENYNFTEMISGHLRYRDLIGTILESVGVSHLDEEYLENEKKQIKEKEEAEQRDLEKWTQDLSLEEKQGAENVQPATEPVSQEAEEHPEVKEMREKVEHETKKERMNSNLDRL
ncbi:hypothetical protein KEM54_002537, partial [Ascosphaera aggregata]